MLLIEIEGGDTPRFRLEFHPRLTVVAGLDAVQRYELSQAIRNALTGRGRRMKLMVDIGGVPLPLDFNQISLFGLDHLEFDNLVDKKSFLGQATVAAESPAPVVKDENEIVSGVGDAKRTLQLALMRVRDLEVQIAALPDQPDPVDAGELASAEGEYTEARQRMDDLRQQLEAIGIKDNELDPEDQLARLEALKINIETRLAELRESLEDQPGDINAIVEAMTAAESSADVIRERKEFADLLGQTGGEWNRIVNEISRLSRGPRPPEWLVLQTKDELDEAQARVKAFTYQLNEGIDVRQALTRAQQKLTEVQAAWDEIEHGAEGQLAIAEDQRDALYENVTRLLGREVRYDQVLDALANQHEELQNQPHPTQGLVDLLKDADIEATYEDALARARSLLDDRRDRLESRAANQQAMATALVDLRDTNHQIAELRNRIENPIDPPDIDDQKDRYEQAVAKAKVAEQRLRELQEAAQRASSYDSARANMLRSDLEEANRLAVEAQQRYEALSTPKPTSGGGHPLATERDLAQEADLPARPWWDGGLNEGPIQDINAGVNDLETYLLARVANLRMLAHGESLPLIIDSVFEGLPADVTVRILEALAKVSAIVQVIYLSGNDQAEKWAKRQDIYTTAVVRLERA